MIIPIPKLKLFVKGILSYFVLGNLKTLAYIFKTDKLGHNCIPVYQRYLHEKRKKVRCVIEIGVGGYNNKLHGANSLRMWKRYFNNSLICGVDIEDKTHLEERRIKIFHGNQTDKFFLEKIVQKIPAPDIIIDDGSHVCSDIISTFNFLFPTLNKGGIYFIEDTQTSYWKDFGGDPDNLDNPLTTMSFFKKITDCVNHSEFSNKTNLPSFYNSIGHVNFYPKLIVISKV